MSRTILCVERCLSAVRRVVLSHANVTACLGPVTWLHANAQRTYEAQEIAFEACCFSTNRSVPLDLAFSILLSLTLFYYPRHRQNQVLKIPEKGV